MSEVTEGRQEEAEEVVRRSWVDERHATEVETVVVLLEEQAGSGDTG